jgi:hypothetical protein
MPEISALPRFSSNSGLFVLVAAIRAHGRFPELKLPGRRGPQDLADSAILVSLPGGSVVSMRRIL